MAFFKGEIHLRREWSRLPPPTRDTTPSQDPIEQHQPAGETPTQLPDNASLVATTPAPQDTNSPLGCLGSQPFGSPGSQPFRSPGSQPFRSLSSSPRLPEYPILITQDPNSPETPQDSNVPETP